MPTTQLDRVLVAATTPDLEAVVTAAIRALREADPAFGDAFESHIAATEAPGAGGGRCFDAGCRPLGPEDGGALADACHERWPDHALRIAFMHRGFADHWFSHRLERQGTVLVSLNDWERISALPLDAFAAYELLVWGGFLLADRYDAEPLIHPEPNGCIFDACIQKASIDLKLRIGDACARCRGLLREMDMPIPRFRRLLDAVRHLAIPPWGTG